MQITIEVLKSVINEILNVVMTYVYSVSKSIFSENNDDKTSRLLCAFINLIIVI